MISSCSTCSGDASLDIAKLMQSASAEQNRISEALRSKISHCRFITLDVLENFWIFSEVISLVIFS